MAWEKVRLDADGDNSFLLNLAKKDQQRATTILLDSHGGEILGYCRKLLGNDSDAEDVCQEVFLQAFNDIPTFEGRSSFRTWLFAIARHRCIDRLRFRRRDAARIESMALVHMDTQESTAEVWLSERALLLAVQNCLDQLSKTERAAVVLKFNDNLSYRQIAELLHSNEGALRVRISRALPRLRRCLETKGYSP